ncbi:MAG: hypothetical protein AAF468_20640 [Pseudomonadota bacterium]
MATVEPLSDAEHIELENLLIAMREPVVVTADYTNWRREKSNRRFIPKRFWIGETEWHPTRALFLHAWDLDKEAYRDFNLIDFDLSTLQRVKPIDAFYPNDQSLLDSLHADTREQFRLWMDELEAHMREWEKAWGNLPYGLPLAKSTGLECWYESFQNQMSAREAFHSDQDHWDDD